MLYFTISELLKSATAKENGYMEQFQPPDFVVDNLTLLVENCLDKLRQTYGKSIHVNCGYRCERLNKKVGGVKTSEHLKGMAADITAGSPAENKKLFDLAVSLNLPFRQLIDEQNYKWIHISYNRDDVKRQILHL